MADPPKRTGRDPAFAEVAADRSSPTPSHPAAVRAAAEWC